MWYNLGGTQILKMAWYYAKYHSIKLRYLELTPLYVHPVKYLSSDKHILAVPKEGMFHSYSTLYKCSV